jgi:hypothetical protein
MADRGDGRRRHRGIAAIRSWSAMMHTVLVVHLVEE